MLKIIGKLNIFFIFLFNFCNSSFFNFDNDNNISSKPTIELKILNNKKQTTNIIQANKDCILQVSLKNFDANFELNEIPGVSNLKTTITPLGTSQSHQNINGKVTKSKTKNFKISALPTGNYNLGPLTIKTNSNQTITSNQLSLQVTDLELNNTKTPNFILEIYAPDEKNTFYVNEKINLKIRFLYKKNFENLKILPSELKNFKALNNIKQEKIENPSLIKNNTIYNFLEYNYDLFPINSGTLNIDNFKASFLIRKKTNNFFSSFLDSNIKEKTQLSNKLNLTILPLPENNEYKDISAIGEFSDFKINCEKNNLNIGEGTTVTISFVGNGNIKIIEIQNLNLPTSFRSYQSTINLEQLESDFCKKTFEFIIQPNEAGEFTIPSQIFSFFNPKNAEYSTLKTEALNLIVKNIAENKENKNSNKIINTDETINNNIDNSIQTNIKKEFNPHINQNIADLHAINEFKIPAKNFFSICFFLIFILSILIIYLILKFIFKKKIAQKTWYKKYKLNKDLKTAIKKSDIKNIYILLQTFLKLNNLQLNIILSTAEQKKWFLFLKNCEASNYFAKDAIFIKEKKLIEQSKYWFKLFVSKCN